MKNSVEKGTDGFNLPSIAPHPNHQSKSMFVLLLVLRVLGLLLVRRVPWEKASSAKPDRKMFKKGGEGF